MEEIGGSTELPAYRRFLQAFFLSAQTLTTVGYGRLNPTGVLSGFLASFEALLGLLLFAIATGLIYGRFSRPEVRLRFSENCQVSPYQHITGLMCRVVNERKHNLLEVEAQIILSFLSTAENKREFHLLEL